VIFLIIKYGSTLKKENSLAKTEGDLSGLAAVGNG
jgi:hypothetical protein